MSEQRNYYDIVKLIDGSLVLDLPAYDTSVNNKIIRFEHDTKVIKVSETHALGVITDPILERMYKGGYFKIEPEAAFLAQVEKKFYPVEAPKAATTEQILNYLKRNNRKAIKDLVAESTVGAENVVSVATAHVDELTQSTIKFLNELLEIELVIEE